MLLKAGADTEAVALGGATPLHMAALCGHLETVRAVIAAGASKDSRKIGRGTPLYLAALGGHVDTVNALLDANADPLLGMDLDLSAKHSVLPLEVAAERGHSGVVREMIARLDIGGCGGPTGGVNALCRASKLQNLGIMSILMKAGVRDTGSALILTAEMGHDAAANLLLQHRRRGEGTSADVASYVNADHLNDSVTPLSCCLVGRRPGCCRILRALLDAGADSAISVPMNLPSGLVSSLAPLGLATELLSLIRAGVFYPTEEHLRVLLSSQRVLLREEAIHAVSWVWPADNAPLGLGVEKEFTAAGGGQPRKGLVTVRWSPSRPGVLLRAMSRLVLSVSDDVHLVRCDDTLVACIFGPRVIVFGLRR